MVITFVICTAFSSQASQLIQKEKDGVVSSYVNTSLIQAENDLLNKTNLSVQDIQQLGDIYTITSESLNEDFSIYYFKPIEPVAKKIYKDGSVINEYTTRAVLTKTKEDYDESYAVLMWSEMTYESKQFGAHTGYRITKSSALIKSFGERYGRNFGTRCVQVGENLVTNQLQRFDSSHKWGDRIVGKVQTYNPNFSGYMACGFNGAIATDVYVDISHNGSSYWTFNIHLYEGTIPNPM